MKAKKNFPGLDGFVWWTGIVENRKDPLKLGRVQIRMYGWHTEEKNTIPTEDLFWAQPVLAANVHQITHPPKEGELVFGFFMDGEYAQFPFYIGIIPNIPDKQYPQNKGFADPGKDVSSRPNTLHSGKTRYPGKGELNQPSTSRSARNENMDQTPYKKSHGGKYPYVFSIQSESGHYIDIDDTPGNERMTLIHRLGSRIDIVNEGIIVHSIGYIHMDAAKEINIKAGNDINITAAGNVNVKGSNINLN